MAPAVYSLTHGCSLSLHSFGLEPLWIVFSCLSLLAGTVPRKSLVSAPAL